MFIIGSNPNNPNYQLENLFSVSYLHSYLHNPLGGSREIAYIPYTMEASAWSCSTAAYRRCK